MERTKDRDYLLAWYIVHNEPTREDVRRGKVSIPEGYNKRIIEGYLPLLKEDYKDIREKIESRVLYSVMKVKKIIMNVKPIVIIRPK